MYCIVCILDSVFSFGAYYLFGPGIKGNLKMKNSEKHIDEKIRSICSFDVLYPLSVKDILTYM